MGGDWLGPNICLFIEGVECVGTSSWVSIGLGLTCAIIGWGVCRNILMGEHWLGLNMRIYIGWRVCQNILMGGIYIGWRVCQNTYYKKYIFFTGFMQSLSYKKVEQTYVKGKPMERPV